MCNDRRKRVGGMPSQVIAQMMNSISDSDVVVDVGGGACPFNRANYIVDIIGFEERAGNNSYGPIEEHFSKDRWKRLDICSEPLPFADKSVDFAVCTHTLEDIRDPVFVCKELNRIAKAGYIECPSRAVESVKNLTMNGIVGYPNHRWFVEIENEEVVFIEKTPLIYSSNAFVLPAEYRDMPLEWKITSLFWRGSFEYRENLLVNLARKGINQRDFIISILEKSK